MAKRNVAYIKPSDPAFLRRIKEQIGYKEGPNVNTKRARLSEAWDGDVSDEDGPDEGPLVVVLQPGDLSADQVQRLRKEEEEGKADLSKRVVFKKPSKEESSGQTTGDQKSQDSGDLKARGSADLEAQGDQKTRGSQVRQSGGGKNSTPDRTPKKGKTKGSKSEKSKPGALSFDVEDDEQDSS